MQDYFSRDEQVETTSYQLGLPTFRRTPGSVEHAQNFHDSSPYSIRDKIAGLGNQQFARSWNAPRTTNRGLCGQQRHRICYAPRY